MKLSVSLSAATAAGRPLRGGRGLKQICGNAHGEQAESPPARGAWIETPQRTAGPEGHPVAPCAGGVD